MKNLPKQIFSALLDLIYPPRCPLCGEPVDKKGEWCALCLNSALRAKHISLPPLSVVIVLGRYRGGLRKLIHRLKYDKRKEIMTEIGTFLKAAEKNFPAAFLQPKIIAVPVPLHKNREHARGFNQAEVIFADWLGSRGIKIERLLSRQKETAPQFNLTAEERRKNLRDAFAVADGASVMGKDILLVDDIITTGTTLKNCAATLLAAGAKNVAAVVLAGD